MVHAVAVGAVSPSPTRPRRPAALPSYPPTRANNEFDSLPAPCVISHRASPGSRAITSPCARDLLLQSHTHEASNQRVLEQESTEQRAAAANLTLSMVEAAGAERMVVVSSKLTKAPSRGSGIGSLHSCLRQRQGREVGGHGQAAAPGVQAAPQVSPAAPKRPSTNPQSTA